MPINGTMLQAFHWDYPADGSLWTRLAADAAGLAQAGFTALWMPPFSKGEAGARDVGYGAYDLFDLGEFDQKGSVRTKHGTRAELEAAVAATHAAGMQVYADAVLNHKGGADATEAVLATPVSSDNRNIVIGPQREIDAWTSFSFPGRGNAYSTFQWRWEHFDAVDYDNRTGERTIFRLRDKAFETPVDPERGNFDYLMFADLDSSRNDVRAELNAWGDWIVRTLAVDGFRFDAARHIRFPFFSEWLDHVRFNAAGRPLFAVGEYFTGNVATLRWFIEQTGRRMSLFDFPLHFALRDAGRGNGGFDLRRLFEGTLVSQDPTLAVTFVDNHDTWQDNRRDEGVAEWFRPHGYALLLLREAGYPCVFWPDWFGTAARPSLQPLLETLLRLRRDVAYGAQADYFDDPDLVGWTRAGDAEHPRALAVVLSDAGGGTKSMPTGRPGRVFREATGAVAAPVTADAAGTAAFPCPDRAIAVWVEDA